MFRVHRSVFRYVPAAFFIGGFVWDAVTLGRSIKPLDLWILLAYLTGAAAILVAIAREVQFRYARYLNVSCLRSTRPFLSVSRASGPGSA